MEAIHECKECNSVFKTANERDSHSRTYCRQTYDLKLEDGSVKVIRRFKDKKFHCPVSTCKTSCTRGDSLGIHYKIHLDKLKQDDYCTEKKNFSFLITPDTSEVPDVLKTANLCVIHHNNLVLLVCMTCNSALIQRTGKTIRKHVRNHVKEHGNIRRHSFLIGDAAAGGMVLVPELEELISVISRYDLTRVDDDILLRYSKQIDAKLLAPVPGIFIHHGFSCQQCVFFCRASRTMDNHRAVYHAQHSISEVSSCCQVQVLFNFVGSNKYYGVEEKNMYGTDDASGDSIQQSIKEGFKSHIQNLPSDPCPTVEEVTPWLRRSSWHEIARELMPEDIPFSEVKAQMLLPEEDSGPLFYIRALISKYMNEVQVLLSTNQVDYTLRQMVKEEGFHRLLREGSVKRYNNVMASFIVSILRAHRAEYSFEAFISCPAGEDLQLALDELLVQLNSFNSNNIENADLGVIHKVMLELWTPKISLFLDPCKSSDCPFIRFLILDSMQEIRSDKRSTTYRFQQVKHQTQIFAMLQYWARGTIFMELVQKFWHSDPRVLQMDEIPGLIKYVTDNVFGTPWNTIAQYMKLASTVATTEPTKPRIFMCDEFSTSCAIDGGSIDVNIMQDMVKSIEAQANAILEKDVLLGMPAPWIDTHLKKKVPIYDEINSCEPHYSFLEDSRNPFFKLHQRDLIDHMFCSRMTASHFVKGINEKKEVIWNTNALLKWMAACSKLQELLLLLVHLTSGLPARGEEYRSLLLRNTTTGDRSFHWRNGQLMIFQAYHKGCNSDAPVKVISRYMSAKYSALYLKDFSLVRPAQSYVAKILWGETSGALYQNAWFIDMGRRLCGEDLSNSLRKVFREHCGFPFSISQYRQIAGFFGIHIKAEGNKSLHMLLDAAGGHTSETFGLHYALTNKDYRFMSSNEEYGYKRVSDLWHMLYGCGIECATIDVGEVHGKDCIISRPRPDVGVEFTRLFKKAKINCVFDVGEDEDDGCCKKNRKVVDPLALISTESARKAKESLQAFKHLAWKSSEQATSVALSIENTSNFIAVLPTGGGKSLIFMAASKSTMKTIIVVVPLQILIISQLQECVQCDFSAAVYEDGRTEVGRAPSILFVSVEIAAESEAFGVFLSQLKLADKIHSVVFDEIHLLLCEYRPVMKKLLRLVMLDCQLIGLSASLPPAQQEAIDLMLSCKMVWVRASTVRPNIRYNVVEAGFDTNDIDVEIKQRLSIWSSKKSSSADRALVYCFSRGEVDDLAEKLNRGGLASTYMHAESSKDAKRKALESWESGKTRIMVATGVIGCGYNYAAVRLVIHKGTFRSLSGFHQESGRAGRDGLMAESYIISNSAYRNNVEKVDHNLSISHKWIEERTKCRRITLHSEMDGKYQMCDLIQDAIPCDICHPAGFIPRPRMPQSSAPLQGVHLTKENCVQGNLSQQSCLEDELMEQNCMEVEVEAMETPKATSLGRSSTSTRTTEVTGRSSTSTRTTEVTGISTLLNFVDNIVQCGTSTQPSAPMHSGVPINKKGEYTSSTRLSVALNAEKRTRECNNLQLVRKFAKDGTTCLLCVESGPHRAEFDHDSKYCLQIKKGNHCLECLGKGHGFSTCENKIPFLNGTCFKCHFQTSPCWGEDVHKGRYGPECAYKKVGERLQLFIWKAWRDKDMHKKLCYKFPEIRNLDAKAFAKWIPQLDPNRRLNNFVRIAAEIVIINFPEM